MANGNPLFGLMPSTDPQQSAQQSLAAQIQNREYGLVTPQGMQPQGQPTPTGFGGPGGMERLQQLYGAMAPYARDPGAMMQNYVSAMQQQQRLDEMSSPMGRALSIYGKVNPHDWTAQSLQQFHNNFKETGQMRFDLLERKRPMSTETEKQIYSAHQSIQDAGQNALRAGDIASRLESAYRSGEWTAGAKGRVLSWFRTQGLGDYKTMEAIKTDFNKFVNTEVINSLPPGVASDRDIQIFQKGFPPDYADAAYLAAYMRGMQKAKALEQAFYRHKSMFLSANETPKGLTADWDQRRQNFAENALRAAGLEMYKPDAAMSDADASRAYFARGQIDEAARTGQIVTPTVAPAGPMAAEPVGEEESIESYMREFGGGAM